MSFRIGDHVDKRAGAYEFPSTVQAIFTNRAGNVRLVCESTQIPGLLHIFSPQQMIPVPAPPAAAPGASRSAGTPAPPATPPSAPPDPAPAARHRGPASGTP